DRSPLETGLAASMQALGASSGAILWREGESAPVGLVSRDGAVTSVAVETARISTLPFLYDLRRHRALCRDAQRNLSSCDPASLIDDHVAASFELGEGLAVPVRRGTGEGQLVIQGGAISADSLDT